MSLIIMSNPSNYIQSWGKLSTWDDYDVSIYIGTSLVKKKTQQKQSILVSDVDDGGGCSCVGAGDL